MTPTYQDLLDIRNRVVNGDLERALVHLRFCAVSDETRNWIRRELEGYAEDDALPNYRRSLEATASWIVWHTIDDSSHDAAPAVADIRYPLSILLEAKDTDREVSYGKEDTTIAISVPTLHGVIAAIEGIIADSVAAGLTGHKGKKRHKASADWAKVRSRLDQLVIGVFSGFVAGQLQ